MTRTSPTLLSFACVVALASPALADPPGASDPCRGRSPGDACEADDFEGTCRRRRCTRETDDGTQRMHCLVCETRQHGHHVHRAHRRDAAVDVPDDGSDDVPGDASNDVPGDASGDAARDVSVNAPTVAVAPHAPAPADRGGGLCAVRSGVTGDGRWTGLVVALWCVLRRRRASSGA